MRVVKEEAEREVNSARALGKDGGRRKRGRREEGKERVMHEGEREGWKRDERKEGGKKGGRR